jgi:hypothetical protein
VLQNGNLSSKNRRYFRRRQIELAIELQDYLLQAGLISDLITITDNKISNGG